MPKQNSSGGKERLGGISRAGNRYLRQMLVVGAMAVIRFAQRHGTKRPWLSASGASARQGRGRGAREQKRAHGLGDHEGRALPRTFRGGGITGRVARRVKKVGKGIQDLMHKPVDPGSGQPIWAVALRVRAFDRDPIRGRHHGQRPCASHLKAEHMAARPGRREESPCQHGAVHTWHFCDIEIGRADVRSWGTIASAWAMPPPLCAPCIS